MAARVLVAMRVPAAPTRVFRAFTEEIGDWWKPNALFPIRGNPAGRLEFEPGPDGRLVEHLPNGEHYEVGRITFWDPPRELAFSWRPSSFSAEHSTQVHVLFDPVGDETRVTVEHLGWDTIPAQHAARHGFPLPVFLQREAEWWQELLGRLRTLV